MIIGIDLDQTLYCLDVIEHASKMLGLNYKSEDVLYWDYDNKNNPYPEYFTHLVFQLFADQEYMGGLKLNKNAKAKLLYWKKEQHEMHIITARRPEVVVATIRCLNKDFGVGFFNGIHFVKHDLLAKKHKFFELKLDVWIDDNSNDLTSADNIGIKTYSICNDYTKYNRTAVASLQNTTAVKNLGEIKLKEEEINGIKNNNRLVGDNVHSTFQHK